MCQRCLCLLVHCHPASETGCVNDTLKKTDPLHAAAEEVEEVAVVHPVEVDEITSETEILVIEKWMTGRGIVVRIGVETVVDDTMKVQDTKAVTDVMIGMAMVLTTLMRTDWKRLKKFRSCWLL